MFNLQILNIINKLTDFGNSFFDKTFGILNNMQGALKGVVAVALLVILGVGVLTLLKKSFKIFGIVILAIVILIAVGILMNI